MATKINTSNYAKINQDITNLMKVGMYSGVSINIYTDEAATAFAVDGVGNIEDKRIAKINQTGAYTITANNEPVNACVDIVFADGASFRVYDNVDSYWYTLEGIVMQRRRF
jgi:aerobic-type carbon monoxide dehydrogenase small subunit (CoxS/CutS family)